MDIGFCSTTAMQKVPMKRKEEGCGVGRFFFRLRLATLVLLQVRAHSQVGSFSVNSAFFFLSRLFFFLSRLFFF
jgi:hypothetical protein